MVARAAPVAESWVTEVANLVAAVARAVAWEVVRAAAVATLAVAVATWAAAVATRAAAKASLAGLAAWGWQARFSQLPGQRSRQGIPQIHCNTVSQAGQLRLTGGGDGDAGGESCKGVQHRAECECSISRRGAAATSPAGREVVGSKDAARH